MVGISDIPNAGLGLFFKGDVEGGVLMCGYGGKVWQRGEKTGRYVVLLRNTKYCIDGEAIGHEVAVLFKKGETKRYDELFCYKL